MKATLSAEKDPESGYVLSFPCILCGQTKRGKSIEVETAARTVALCLDCAKEITGALKTK